MDGDTSFLGRMDLLQQRLSNWKAQSEGSAVNGPIARSFVGLKQFSRRNVERKISESKERSVVESLTSKASNPSGLSGTLSGFSRSSSKTSMSRSPKNFVSILPSAREWLQSDTQPVKPVNETQNSEPSTSKTPEIVKNEWQRSRNKLIEGSPSRRLRIRSPTRAGQSPTSRSRDFSEENRFCMGTDVLSSETIDNPRVERNVAFEDEAAKKATTLSFEARIQALQDKAAGLPTTVREA